MGMKARKPGGHKDNKATTSIKGQIEAKLERAALAWKRRCQGATYETIARELGVSITAAFKYCDDSRALLREQCVDLAEKERDAAIALLDRAIEKIVPHIEGDVIIETEHTRTGADGRMQRYIIRVEEWQARCKACQVLVSLLDRKAKLLGMDAPVKVEAPAPVPAETEEQRARVRAALKQWTKFSIDPKDFQSTDLT